MHSLLYGARNVPAIHERFEATGSIPESYSDVISARISRRGKIRLRSKNSIGRWLGSAGLYLETAGSAGEQAGLKAAISCPAGSG